MPNNKTTPSIKMGPGSNRAAPVQKARNFKQTSKKFLGYISDYKAQLILVLLFAIMSTIFAIVGPKILGNMTTEVVSGLMRPSGIDFNKIGQIGLLLIGLYLASALFGYIQNWIMTNISQDITYKLRKDISKKIAKLPLSYFDKHETGDMVSRITNDVETISQNLNQSMTQAITSLVTVVGITVMMFSIGWQLTLIALSIIPIIILLTGIVIKKSQPYYKKQQTFLGKVDGHIDEMFANHAIVKTFNGEKQAIDRFNKINEDLYESGWKSQFLSGIIMPITFTIRNISYVAVAMIGGIFVIQGRISIGDIQAFLQYINQFTRPISQLANIANIFQSTIAAAERVFEFLEETEQPIENAKLLPNKNIKGQVEFNDVHFGYDDTKDVIKGLNVNIKPKQNIAIVGPTGVGKTTIVNLLMRFYDINSGQIKIDGIDINQMKREDVRKMFSMVLQDTWLFNGTIADNIAYSRPNSSKKDIIKAAKAAHAHHLITTLPKGYDTVMSESIDSISAGEKQLITIARAILANSPMLILDEATSSVDTRTELLIQSAMDKLSHGRTSFVIAHRLSTIKDADIILVVKDGNIIEQGGHNHLMAKNGYYTELYNSQFANS